MPDRPIIFSAPMVRALLDGRKRQTRRIIKPQPVVSDNGSWRWEGRNGGFVGAAGTHINEGFPDSARHHARIQPGDRLWVKETHAIVPRTAYRMSEGVQQTLRPNDDHDAAVYAAGWERSKPGRWRPSIHQPRWASRLTLTVTDVRVEKLQDITLTDLEAEGIVPAGENLSIDEASAAWQKLWDSINGAGAWNANPWVTAYSFAVHLGNIDLIGGSA